MPRQSGSSVVTLFRASVKVEPTSPSSTDGAGLPDVPLLVQPCSWSGAEFFGREVGLCDRSHPSRTVVADRDQVRHRVLMTLLLSVAGVICSSP